MNLMTQEQKELLRIEYYKVMEYSQPFGNEHHEELFEWFISKIKEAEWQKQDIEASKKIESFLTKWPKQCKAKSNAECKFGECDCSEISNFILPA